MQPSSPFLASLYPVERTLCLVAGDRRVAALVATSQQSDFKLMLRALRGVFVLACQRDNRYVPLDPKAPTSRSCDIMRDTRMGVIITETGLCARLPVRTQRYGHVSGRHGTVGGSLGTPGSGGIAAAAASGGAALRSRTPTASLHRSPLLSQGPGAAPPRPPKQGPALARPPAAVRASTGAGGGVRSPVAAAVGAEGGLPPPPPRPPQSLSVDTSPAAARGPTEVVSDTNSVGTPSAHRPLPPASKPRAGFSHVVLVVVDPAGEKPPMTLARQDVPVAVSTAGHPDSDVLAMCARRGPHTRLAYILYTSGTTGKPKGVCIAHHGVVNQIVDVGSRLVGASALARTLFSTNVCFDASVDEIWMPLVHGGTIVVAQDLLDLVAAGGASGTVAPHLAGVTMLNGTPSAMQMLLETKAIPPSVVAVELGGEASTAPLVSKLYQAGVACVLNMYGPTECTNECLATVLPGDLPAASRVPIGRPIANMRAFVVDEHMQLVALPAAGPGCVDAGTPPTVVGGDDAGDRTGELLVSGFGVALGYLRRPELSAQKFVANPFGGEPQSIPVYRTGDKVRVRDDGTIEFIGRIDTQVKVRGFRIELEEVEAVVCGHPAVAACVAAVQDGQLVAHILPAARKPGRGGYIDDADSSRTYDTSVASGTPRHGGGGGGGQSSYAASVSSAVSAASASSMGAVAAPPRSANEAVASHAAAQLAAGLSAALVSPSSAMMRTPSSRLSSVPSFVSVAATDGDDSLGRGASAAAGAGGGIPAMVAVQALQAYVASRVPAYMIPSAFATIDQLPLTATGKVDRKALPRVPMAVDDAQYVPPENDEEEAMAQLWAEALNRRRVGVTTSFFKLGGDSLTAIRTVSRARASGFPGLTLKLLMTLAAIRPLVAHLTAHPSASGAGAGGGAGAGAGAGASAGGGSTSTPTSRVDGGGGGDDDDVFGRSRSPRSPASATSNQPHTLPTAEQRVAALLAAVATNQDTQSARLRTASVTMGAGASASSSGYGVLEDVYPLSAMQSGMLFTSLHEPGSGVYVDQWLCDFAPGLDVDALAASWRRVVGRHASLRTSFVWKGVEHPLQVVWALEACPMRWTTHDLSQERDAKSVMADILARDRKTGFDMSCAPLMRFTM